MEKPFKIRLGRERWHRAIILFTAIFIFSVIIQFAIRWYERGAEARSRLRESAEEIGKHIAYSERWELIRLWRADFTTSSYWIIDNNGLIINIQGFLPVMEVHVSLNKLLPGIRTIILPETGEPWRILVKPLMGGTVILGISPPQDVSGVDSRLKTNAKLFGSSLDDALKINTDQVDMYLEYAIVDDNQKLRYAIGAIPLRVLQKPVYPVKANEIIAEDGYAYGVFSQAVLNKQARTVGTIYTLEKLNPQPWLILRTWIANCLSSAILAFFGTLIGIPFIGEKFDPRKFFISALQAGESQTVEFKESLRWDHWQEGQQAIDEIIKKPSEAWSRGEMVALKNIAAFLNNQVGGTLFIGVSDDKRVAGLERDYESLVKKGELRGDRNKDRDLFQLHLRHKIAANFNKDISNLYIETAIIDADGADVCVVRMRPSAVPVYLTDTKGKSLYVRHGSNTESLDVAQAVEYVEQRWPRSFWRRVKNTLHSS